MNDAGRSASGKLFLVTGGTSGVGKAIAKGLAKTGATVVIISRNPERGQAAVNDIAAVAGRGRCEFLTADLSLQSSVRSVAEAFTRKYDRLDALVNAGGAIYFERQRTAEGVDRMFAVNMLSHFGLTNRLLDMLKASRPSRVVTVVGNPRFFRNATLDMEDIQLERNYSNSRVMVRIMVAKTMFAFELARRLKGTGVTSVAFHPGWVKSNLARNAPWYVRALGPAVNGWAKPECPIGVYLAAAEEAERATGVFFDHKQRTVPLHLKHDEEAGKQLWSICAKLAGVSAT